MTGCIDLSVAGKALTDLADHPAGDRDIGPATRGAGPVDDRAAADHYVCCHESLPARRDWSLPASSVIVDVRVRYGRRYRHDDHPGDDARGRVHGLAGSRGGG